MSDMEAPQAQLSRERMMSTPNAHLPPRNFGPDVHAMFSTVGGSYNKMCRYRICR